ncbi:Senescence-associated protein spa15, chloroplastic [Datura stramonium]|uniref:Senescence-associated protein spa15, chloroplastic n=1 Tax=Datura stramonium TaxID=4076 RepID=A0ABS8V9A2_DATST|nr:Senescence-associated protein spa15, chloroplastic [Datura stramonium]
MATSNGIIYSAKSPQHPKVHTHSQGIEHSKHNGYSPKYRLKFSNKGFWEVCGKLSNRVIFRGSPVLCHSTETHDTETKEFSRNSGDCSNISSVQEDDHAITVGKVIPSSQAIAEACKFAYNDAKFVNERAKNDIVLLSREIMRMDARARQDVAFLGSEFLKLDARAREDTEKVDHDVKKRAERLHHVATILKNIAQSRLKKAADRHWSDGALEADLRRADFVAKQRAMEDSLMALEFVKNIHDRMVRKMYKFSIDAEKTKHITLEKNGKTLEFLPGEVSADRITAIQEAYWDIASALSEADGVDYTDPEELELLVATLIDLDAMDGKSSVSLLAECSSSPDVNTRKALANALSAAPSMWTLGNAGMGALQRLAEDDNPAIAAAASKTILELKRQWEIGEGDSWRFMVDEVAPGDVGSQDDIKGTY